MDLWDVEALGDHVFQARGYIQLQRRGLHVDACEPPVLGVGIADLDDTHYAYQDLPLGLDGWPEPHHVADVELEPVGHLLGHDRLELGAAGRDGDRVGRHPPLQEADVALQVGEVLQEAARNVESGDAPVGDGVLRVAHELAGAPEVLGVALVGPRNGPAHRVGQGLVGPRHGRGGQDGVGREDVYLHGLLRQPLQRGLERKLFQGAEVDRSARAQRDRHEDGREDAGQEQPVLGDVLCCEAELAGLVHQSWGLDGWRCACINVDAVSGV